MTRSVAVSRDESCLLDGYPLLRSRSVEDAQSRIGRVFSPHRLEVQAEGEHFDVRHNRMALKDSALHVLHYGAEVTIDAGERGNFYLVQVPLSGHAQLTCDGREAAVDESMLSVLQPCTSSRMRWSSSCTMLLLQAPSALVHERTESGGRRPCFALSRRRTEPEVAAWWQAALDMVRNLDRFGDQWRAHPAAVATIEDLLLTAFTCLLRTPGGEAPVSAEPRSLRRAKEYIHAHLDAPLTLADIARHACVGQRTLELVFKRNGEPAPLAYVREQRLLASHGALRRVAREGSPLGVTDIALAYGFVHMGRFSAQYRARFGCLPSQTLKRPSSKG